MPLLIFVCVLAAIVWAAIALVHGSVFLATALFLVSTACLPSELFSYDLGGITVTLDRLWLLVLLLKAGVQWYRGSHRFLRLESCDVALGLFAMWLIIRTITQPLGAQLPGQPPTLMHLIIGYLIPATIYAIVRCSSLDKDKLLPALWVMFALAAYLSITAFLEIAQVWSLVFPKYIAQPELGIHFGRARGPMLQSVRLGMCLVSCWVLLTVYTIWLNPMDRFRWLFHSMFSLLIVGAIYLTYTRSIWIGFALAAGFLAVFGLHGFPRRLAIFTMLIGIIVGGAIKGPELLTLKRGTSGAETRESTYMRSAFAYVSIEMFKERPIAGYGFNQFQIYNPPFLADRTTEIRLESIRGYVHHNGFLSLLVDLGLIGFSLYLAMIVTFFSQAWSLWHAKGVPQWVRGLALVFVAVMICHHVQMAFHELSFATIENGLLFAACGLVVAAKQQYCLRPTDVSSEPDTESTD